LADAALSGARSQAAMVTPIAIAASMTGIRR
jgi:hypothetical protein